MSPLIEQLIEALRILPGVGPKSAQRMVLHLLERNPQGGLHLANCLKATIEGVDHCKKCRNLTENELCSICENPARNDALICVVESPADVIAIEQAGGYRGHYFVLMGHLSPIDGVGPGDLGIDALVDRVSAGQVKEVIMAVNPTVEGEATSHYISELLRPAKITLSRLAHGIPVGGELEYIDSGTIAHALEGRKAI
jgi:recombination protein RecR